MEIGFEDLGEQPIKNIADPIRCYNLLLNSEISGQLVSFNQEKIGKDQAVICFVDDDPVEIDVFKNVFGDRYRIIAATRLQELLDEVGKAQITPDLFILDLYFPSGRDSTEEERIEMVRLKKQVDDAERKLSDYLNKIEQGRDGGLAMLELVQNHSPSVPVSFYTRKGTIDDAIACVEAGADHVLRKPQPESINLQTDIFPQLEAAGNAYKSSLSFPV